jgi:activating signal cointegrator 1
MRALTLTQPWATLVATGDKRIETRSWSTDHRGPIAIHAAKELPGWAITWALNTPAVLTMLSRAGYYALAELPLGMIVATCQIVGCASTDGPSFRMPAGKDRILGNFAPGRYAIYLEDITRVEPPVPARGMLGLWEWDNEAAGVEALVTGRLF